MLPKPVGRLEGKAVWRPGLRSESDRAAPAAPNSWLLLALGCWGLGVFDVVWIHSRSLDSVSWLCGISFTATKHKLNTEMLVFLGQMSMCWSLQRKTSMDTQLCLFFLFNRKLRLQFVCFLLLCLHWRWPTAGQGSWHTCLRATLVLLDCSQTLRWTLGSAELQAAVLSELLTFLVARLWTFPGFCVLLYFKIHCDKAMGSWS